MHFSVIFGVALLAFSAVAAAQDRASALEWVHLKHLALGYGLVPLLSAATVLAFTMAWRRWRRQTVEASEPVAEYGRAPIVWAVVVMCVGLAFSYYQVLSTQEDIEARAELRFQQQVDRIEADIEAQFERPLAAMRGLRGTVVASQRISQAEFRDWVRSHDMELEFPGVRGLGLARRIGRNDVAAFVQARRKDGASEYAVQSSGAAQDLFLVEFIEPLETNRAALGLDLGAETSSRVAAERSMREGLPALSEPVVLVQDGQRRTTFLYFLPIFATPKVPPTEVERLRLFRGWAYVPIVLSKLLAPTHQAAQGLVDFTVLTGSDQLPKTRLYESALSQGSAPDSEPRMVEPPHLFSASRPMRIGGQILPLQVVTTPAFDQTVDLHEPARLAFTGAALSVMAAMVLWMLLVGQSRAEVKARGMTRELDRLALVARRTSNAVVMTDNQGFITWVNEGYVRITGFTLEESLGRKPGELLQCESTDPDTIAAIREDLQALRPSRHVILNRNKSGVDYWIKLEIQPLRNERGFFYGFMAVETDVTAEREAEARLAVEKERADNILAGTNVGTWESNLVTGESYFNVRWASMLGYAPEEIQPNADQFWQAAVHPDDAERLNSLMARCIAGDSDDYAVEVRARCKDGSWAWISSRAKVMSRTARGRAEWIGGIHTDISHAKETEARLRNAEAFLKRAGRIAGVAPWQFHVASQRLFWSDQACDLHGVLAGFKPSLEYAFSFYPPAVQASLRHAIQLAVEQGVPWDMTVPFESTRGTSLWVRTVGERDVDSTGAVRLVGALLDVTEQQESLLRVESSQALLRGAIDTINEAFVLYDQDDCLVYCNEKYRLLYGRSAEFMVEGASFESIIRGGVARGQYPDATGREEEWVAERLKTHQSGNVELEQRLDDGRWLKVVERKMPDGHIVGFRVDITELKAATEAAQAAGAALAKERESLGSILAGTNVGTWEWNIQAGTQKVNDRWASMLGYSLAELAPVSSTTWERLLQHDDLDQCRFLLDEHFNRRTEYFECEVRMAHKQGHWVWVLTRGKVSQWDVDGKALMMSGTHMDITERKAVEESLAGTSATLQAVLNSAVDVAIIATSLDRTLTVFNQGAERLLGYRAREVVGQRTSSIFFDPLELLPYRGTLMQTLGREPTADEVFSEVVASTRQSEWTFVRKDGSKVPVSLLISPMQGTSGELVGYLGIAYDISRQKEYEASLREATRQAEQSSVAKSQFLANMSHEIRTPMNAILGMLKLLEGTELTERQRDYAHKTESAARSLLGLLNDILDFSKVEAGKMALSSEPFALEDLMADLSVILSSNLGNKNVDVLFDLDPQIPSTLVGDALRIKQVLINLGGNAVKFTSEGAVLIRWKLLSRHSDTVQVEIDVQDSGIGIALEVQAHIFESFSQAEASTTRRFGGTGLGLTISQRLVALMGGELTLQSELGRGSVFSFTIGLQTLEAPQALQVPVTAPVSLGEVLLVDDNTTALQTITSMLQSLGYQVTALDSGVRAVDFLRERLQASREGLVAILVDWQMPGMDGWETLRCLRQMYGANPLPPMVMLSGHGRELLNDLTQREQELLQGFLVKPVTPAMVASALAVGRKLPQPERRRTVQNEVLRLSGMRILVVEDNAINQQVAEGLLVREGALVTLAENGQIGVQAVASADPPFDVVLMDLQMPIMDGFSATRAIRLTHSATVLPIIAMTANAMVSDREACLEAGMNDHVGKPFDLNHLVQVLLKYTGRTDIAAQAHALPEASANAVAWPVEVDGVTALARMGGNGALLGRALWDFAHELTLLPAKASTLLTQNDLSTLRRELHSVKGLAGTLGVRALAERAAVAEKAVDAAGVPSADLPRCLDALVAEIRERVPSLKALALQLGAGSTETVRLSDPVLLEIPDHMVGALQALLAALRASDMCAVELHAKLQQAQSAPLENAMAALDASMNLLDFVSAASQCEELLKRVQAQH